MVTLQHHVPRASAKEHGVISLGTFLFASAFSDCIQTKPRSSCLGLTRSCCRVFGDSFCAKCCVSATMELKLLKQPKSCAWIRVQSLFNGTKIVVLWMLRMSVSFCMKKGLKSMSWYPCSSPDGAGQGLNVVLRESCKRRTTFLLYSLWTLCLCFKGWL